MNKKENKWTYSPSEFLMKVINGATVGIIVAVIPNAIFGQIFPHLADFWTGFTTLGTLVQVIQLLMPVFVGVGVAIQFDLNPMQMLSTAAAAYIGSGSLALNDGVWTVSGIGDTINAMLTSGIAVLLVLLIRNKVKAFATIAYPTIIALGAGAIGVVTLPFVSKITTIVGDVVARATELRPLLMSIIIAIIFALLILTPVSVVAVAFAINLTGLGSGAANLGLVAVVVFTAIGSYRAKNDTGITLALMLGGVKTMMPAFFKNLQMAIPITIVSGFMGAMAPIFNIQGTPGSAGFGFAGLVGPIVAYGYLENSVLVNLISLVLVYAVIPVAVCLVAHWLSNSIFHILKYSNYEIKLS